MNKLKKLIKRANLNVKVELIILLALNLLFIAGIIVILVLIKNPLYIAPLIFFLLLADLGDILRFYYLAVKRENENFHALVILFRHLYVDVNHNIKVLDAFERLKGFANLEINAYINNLLESKDETLAPYLAFAHQFPSLLIEEMMVALYRLQHSSKAVYLSSFNEVYLKLRDLDNKQNKSRLNWQFDFIKITAVIGVAIILLIVIVSVVIMVGKFLYE